MNERTYNFNVTEQEANVIVASLAKQPYEVTANIIHKLQEQAKQPKPEEVQEQAKQPKPKEVQEQAKQPKPKEVQE